MSENYQKFIRVLSNVLDIDVNTISDDTSPENTKNWDSFNALLLISELESEFKISFTMSEMYAIKNVKDIKDVLKSHKINLAE